MNLSMYGPEPPPPTPTDNEIGGGPGGYTGGTYIGDYKDSDEEGRERYKKFLDEELKKLKAEDEDFIILLSQWIANNN